MSPSRRPLLATVYVAFVELIASGAAGVAAAEDVDATEPQTPIALARDERCVMCVAFSPDGRFLVAGTGDQDYGSVRVWDFQTLRETATKRGHRGYVYSVAVAPDSSRIVSGSFDGTTRMWSTGPGEQHKIYRDHRGPVYSVAFSNDGALFASADKESVQIRRTADAGMVHRLAGHDEHLAAVAFSPDGKLIACAGLDKVLLWDLTSGAKVAALEGLEYGAATLAFASNGKTLAAGSRFGGAVHLFDVDVRGQGLEIKGESPFRKPVAFSPVGQLLVIADGASILFVDPRSGAREARLDTRGVVVRSLAVSPDGKTLASAGSDKTIRLWRMPRPAPRN